jgi:hypothetical protein
MPNTFTLIASSTVGSGGAAEINFTSIPSTYTDLAILASLRTNIGNTSDQTRVKFNTSSSSFTAVYVLGTGSTVLSNPITGGYVGNNPTTDQTSNTFSSLYVYVPNYLSSNNKSFSSDATQENNATYALTGIISSLWSNSDALTGITLYPVAGSWVQYSTAYLYGIKKD